MGSLSDAAVKTEFENRCVLIRIDWQGWDAARRLRGFHDAIQLISARVPMPAPSLIGQANFAYNGLFAKNSWRITIRQARLDGALDIDTFSALCGKIGRA